MGKLTPFLRYGAGFGNRYFSHLAAGDFVDIDMGVKRVFNPVLQGTKFDPDGEYVRRYVPELSKLSTKHIHAPWKAPVEVLSKAGIELGKDYPVPIVDHGAARDRALKVYKQLG